jgi:hypothetical protein
VVFLYKIVANMILLIISVVNGIFGVINIGILKIVQGLRIYWIIFTNMIQSIDFLLFLTI